MCSECRSSGSVSATRDLKLPTLTLKSTKSSANCTVRFTFRRARQGFPSAITSNFSLSARRVGGAGELLILFLGQAKNGICEKK